MRGKMGFSGTRAWMLRMAAGSLYLGLCLTALSGCGVGSEIDREPTIASGIRVDSVSILPRGSRFVLRDSLTRLVFGKFFRGYACSRILEMDLDSVSTGMPPAFLPLTRVRLPASADCALDSAGRDSLVTHVFREPEGLIRLANSAGRITDSAQVVSGTMSFDSLTGIFSTLTRTFSSGHYSVVDSAGQTPRYLYIDTLACGRYLNQAEFSPQGDSLKVRLSIVTLDPAAAPGSCQGTTHEDTVTVRKSR